MIPQIIVAFCSGLFVGMLFCVFTCFKWRQAIKEWERALANWKSALVLARLQEQEIKELKNKR